MVRCTDLLDVDLEQTKDKPDDIAKCSISSGLAVCLFFANRLSSWTGIQYESTNNNL